MSPRRRDPAYGVLYPLLRDVRKERKLSQAAVAKRLNRPQSFVSKYETGERRLDLVELRQVCAAVGISLTTLVRRFEKDL
jgi:transcriptional regulator with XRE-family HTH domain